MSNRVQEAVERAESESVPVSAELVATEPPRSLATVFGVEQGQAVIQRASEMAAPLADVIEKQNLYVAMGRGKRHVTVEGWTLLGSMVGVHPHTVYVDRVTDVDENGKIIELGWKATVEARRLDGQVMSTAESMCLRDEDRWGGRASFQLASMAQTRATSKAMRQALSFVMVLAGFNATPAEEISNEEPLAPQIMEAMELGFNQDDILVEARKYTKERGGKNQIRNLKVLSKAPGEYLDELLRRLKASQNFEGEAPAADGPEEAPAPTDEEQEDDKKGGDDEGGGEGT